MLQHSETNLGKTPCEEACRQNLSLFLFFLYKSLPHRSSDGGFHSDSRSRTSRWCLSVVFFQFSLDGIARLHHFHCKEGVCFGEFLTTLGQLSSLLYSHILKCYFCDVGKYYGKNGDERNHSIDREILCQHEERRGDIIVEIEGVRREVNKISAGWK